MDYLFIIIIHLLAVIGPGPDFLIVTKNTLNYSKKIGIYTAIGIALGVPIHIAYSILSVKLLAEQSALIATIILYLGATYLVYIGIMSTISPKIQISNPSTSSQNTYAISDALQDGFLVNLLNPKASIFFITIFTLKIPATTPTLILIILATIMSLNTGLWLILIANLFSNKTICKIYAKHNLIFNRIIGILIILIGLELLWNNISQLL